MMEALKSRMKRESFFAAFFLLSVFNRLINEYVYHKGYDLLYEMISGLVEKTKMVSGVKALVEDIILYALYLANGDSELANRVLDDMRIDVWDLSPQTAAETAAIREGMMASLPKIGRMLAVIWLVDDNTKEIRKPKAFMKRLGSCLVEFSVDVIMLTDGQIMHDPEYDFDYDLRLFEKSLD